MIGGAGSLLLDWYGWESVFYFSGFLTLLWVYCMCKYLLNEKGNPLAMLAHIDKCRSPGCTCGILSVHREDISDPLKHPKPANMFLHSTLMVSLLQNRILSGYKMKCLKAKGPLS